MFIAKFSQVNGLTSKFKPNKHGQLPFIGTILKGAATASIIDAAIFENEGLVAGQLYLCENGVREYNGKNYPTVQVVGPVTAAEYMTSASALGAARLSVPKAEVVETPATPETTETPVVPVAPVAPVLGAVVNENEPALNEEPAPF